MANQAEQGTVLRFGADASSFVAESGRVNQAVDQIAQGMARAVAATGQQNRSLQATGQAFDRLVRTIDDSARAAAGFARGWGTISRAVENGVRDTKQAEAAIDALARKWLGVGPAAQAAAEQAKAALREIQTAGTTAFDPAAIGRGAFQDTRQSQDASAEASRLDQLRAAYDPLYAAEQRHQQALREIGDLERAGKLSGEALAQAKQREADSFQRAAAAADTGANRLDQLRAKYLPLYAAQQQLTRGMAELQALERAEPGRVVEIAAARDRLRAAYEREVVAQRQVAGASTLASLQPYQRLNLGYQIQDFVIQASTGGGLFRPLVQQAPQAVDAVGGVSKATAILRENLALLAGAGGLGLVVGGLALLAVSAERSQRAVNTLGNQLGLGRDNARAVAEQVNSAARSLAETTSMGTQQARDALLRLARIPEFQATRENLIEAGKVAQEFATRLGVDVVQGAERLAEALRDPARAAQEMIGQVKGVDAALVETLGRLQREGNLGAAQNLLFRAIAEAAKGAADNLTPLQRALRDLNEALTESGNKAGQAGGGIGTAITNGLADAVNTVERLVRGLNDLSQSRLFQGMSGMFRLPNLLDSASLPIDIVRGGQTPASPANGPAMPPAATGSAPSPAALNAAQPAAVPYLTEAAQIARVDPALLALAQGREAGLNPDGSPRTSSAGAVGAMQMMPGTYADMARKYGLPEDGLRDPRWNSIAGSLFLRERLDARGGSVPLALADYNAGPGRVDFLRGQRAPLPLETQRYVDAIGGQYRGQAIQGAAPNRQAVQQALTAPPAAANAQPAAAATGEAAGEAPGPFRTNRSLEANRTLNEVVEGGTGTEVTRRRLEERIGGLEQARQAFPEGSQAWRDLTEEIERNKGALYQAVDAHEQFMRDLRQQNAVLQELDPAQRTVNEALARYDEAMKRATGSVASQAQREAYAAEVRRGLTLQYLQTVDAAERAGDSQERLAAAAGQGVEALQRQQAAERAHEEVRKSGIQGAEARAAAEAKLTEEYLRQVRAADQLRTASLLTRQRQQIEGISTERQIIGASPEERARVLADLQARQYAENTPGATPQQIEQFRRYQEQIQLSSEALYREQGAWREWTGTVSNALDTVAQKGLEALQTGKWKDFRDAAVSAINDIANEFIKLVALNPLKNMLLGTSYPTLGGGSGGAGILSTLFGGGSESAALGAASGAFTAGAGGYAGMGPFLASARGNIFDRGDAVPFAKGGLPGVLTNQVVQQPTYFPMAGGKTGLLGEAGPEAIVPLAPTAGGRHGVRVVAEGGQETVAPLTRSASGHLAVQAFATGDVFFTSDGQGYKGAPYNSTGHALPISGGGGGSTGLQIGGLLGSLGLMLAARKLGLLGNATGQGGGLLGRLFGGGAEVLSRQAGDLSSKVMRAPDGTFSGLNSRGEGFTGLSRDQVLQQKATGTLWQHEAALPQKTGTAPAADDVAPKGSAKPAAGGSEAASGLAKDAPASNATPTAANDLAGDAGLADASPAARPGAFTQVPVPEAGLPGTDFAANGLQGIPANDALGALDATPVSDSFMTSGDLVGGDLAGGSLGSSGLDAIAGADALAGGEAASAGIGDAVASGFSNFAAGVGDFFGGIGDFFAGLFHEGGRVGAPGRGRMVSRAALANAPRYHAGGRAAPNENLASDEVVAVLRRNEVVLTEAQARNVAGMLNDNVPDGQRGAIPAALRGHSRPMAMAVGMDLPRYHGGGVAGGPADLATEGIAALQRRPDMLLTEPLRPPSRAPSPRPASGAVRPIYLQPIFQISTPDVAGFRKSQGQLATDIAGLLTGATRRI